MVADIFSLSQDYCFYHFWPHGNFVPVLQDVKTTEPSVTLVTDTLTFVPSGPCSHSLQQAMSRKQLHYFHWNLRFYLVPWITITQGYLLLLEGNNTNLWESLSYSRKFDLMTDDMRKTLRGSVVTSGDNVADVSELDTLCNFSAKWSDYNQLQLRTINCY